MAGPAWRQALAIAGLTLAVFSGTLGSGFVYDARMQILVDPFLHDPANWLPVLSLRVLGMDVLDFNRPVHLASLMLDAAIWGREPFGYHLTSILLHAVNAVLVWGVTRAVCAAPIGGADEAAAGGLRPAAGLFAAAVFACHPLATEAVCEPTYREDLLVAGFTLAAVLLALGHAPAAAADPWRACGCILCSFLAVGSKESGIAAPLVLATTWLVLRRGDPPRFWATAVVGGLLVAGCFLAARLLLEPSSSRIFTERPTYVDGSLAAAARVQPRILAAYLRSFVLPTNLSADYDGTLIRGLPLPVAIGVLAVVAGAWGLAIRLDRRMALPAALVVLPLLPVSNLVPIYRPAADRYLYLPLAGVAIAVGCLLEAPWVVRRPLLRRRILEGLTVAVFALACGSMARQRVWADPVALWTDAYRKNPTGERPILGLAGACNEAGRSAEAERLMQPLLQGPPGKTPHVIVQWAIILETLGKHAPAHEAARRAAAADPRFADPFRCVADLMLTPAEADLLTRALAP